MKPKASEMIPFSYTYIGTSYAQMDCQAFVEKCLKDIGVNVNLAGSNAWYRHCTWTGSPEECIKAFGHIPTGAFLFILEPVSAKTPAKYQGDGKGDATHIGLFTNQRKGAIHSSSSKGCVCESDFRGKTIPNGGWNRVGLDQSLLDYGVDQEGGNAMTAIVTAENGSTVKMREQPSTKCRIYTPVPIGSEVTVLDRGGEWATIEYNAKKGYMMSKYLAFEEEPAERATGASVSVPRDKLEEIYLWLGEVLR